MTIEEIIQIAENKLAFLALHREAAFQRGDLPQVIAYDGQITQTTETLARLKTLQSI